MKIDLVGPKQRGLAMGLNEFAGYLAVAIAAYATGAIAERYGLRPEPFYLGIAVVGLGLALSLLFVRDTTAHVRHESSSDAARSPGGRHLPGMRELFALSSWRHPALFSASQAGLMNNLNDGLAWGLFPLFFAQPACHSVRSDCSPSSIPRPGVWCSSGRADCPIGSAESR